MSLKKRVYIIGLLLLMILVWGCGNLENDRKLDSTNKAQQKMWESAWPLEKAPPGFASMRAIDCGVCHVDIYREWQQSTHAKAFKDLQFQAEWKKDGLYLCANCHTPLQNQQPFKVTGLQGGDYHTPLKVRNQDYDPILEKEGITCAVCHVRDGSIIGPRGTKAVAHPVKKDRNRLRNLCIKCHNVQDKVNQSLVCTFSTGDEWEKSQYAKKDVHCVDCHMPAIERPLVDGGKIYSDSRQHTLPGMGIAKFHKDQAFVRKNFTSGLEIEILSRDSVFQVGETYEFHVKVINQFAGHAVPTGDPERFVLVTMKIVDENDDVLKEKQERIGELWQWHPVAKKISDNRLKPKESRLFKLTYRIPEGKQRLSLYVEVSNHRITQENARSLGIKNEYPTHIIVFSKKNHLRMLNRHL